MAARSVDAAECFSSLIHNVPAWITRVTDLAQHTAAKHAEFSAEYAKLSKTEKKRQTPSTRRKKNSSLHTHRPAEEGKLSPNPPKPDPDDNVMDPMTLLRLQRQHPDDLLRKKGPQTSRSPNTNNETVSRTRHQVVIHYDTHTQQVLESLVRDIGGARNNIRKGRMNSMMKMGFGMKSAFASNNNLDDTMKPVFRSTRSQPPKGQQTAQDSPFDTVDKYLESAQMLCEGAAHQFLRNGNCSAELDKTKDLLDTALDTAKIEAERLQAEKKKAEAEEPPREPEPVKIKGAKDLNSMNAIEVDDASDSSSISIDITAFRRNRLRG